MKEFFLKKEVQIILALVLVAIAPLILARSETVESGDEDVRLVIMTPHNETIRREFGEAFSAYWKEKTGKKVYVDWRSPGGTAEIRLVLKSDFAGAAKDEGIGKDVMFGGGDHLFKGLAKEGKLVELDVFKNRKEWFGPKGIQKTFSGEQFYDPEKKWVGVCTSEFGICYNTDGIKRIGVPAPKTWDDLGDPRYFGKIALADPTKSGSAAKAFEMMIQQKISDELKVVVRQPGENRKEMRDRAIREGWKKGLQLIQRISANARYFTDSASKVPHDVAQGDAVAGMCIDFYGRTYNQKLTKADGTSRLKWISPQGGTSTSVDPVGVFRGAPNSEVAQGFVEFLLSERGQVLWNKRPGTTNGPEFSPLRRLPVRKDVYTKANLKDFTDADHNPYTRKDGLIYDSKITGALFNVLREEIRVMCLHTHDELQEAWSALIDSSVNGKMNKKALKRFQDVVLFSYKKSQELKRVLDRANIQDTEQQTRVLRRDAILNEKATIFRRFYADTVKLAKKGKSDE